MTEPVDSASDERTANDAVRHKYRALNTDEKLAMVRLKDLGLILIHEIDKSVPAGHEATLAKTKVEEAVMWAVKGLTK